MNGHYNQSAYATAPAQYPNTQPPPQQRFQTLVLSSLGYVKRHVLIKPESNYNASSNHGFFAEKSVYTPGKPDITLHRGESKSGPVAGVARFPSFSQAIRVGIVRGAREISSVNERELEWEELRQVTAMGKLFGSGAKGAKTGDTVFSVPAQLLNLGNTTVGEGQIKLAWRATHHDHMMASTGAKGAGLSLGSLKLVPLNNPDLALAQFERNRNIDGRLVLLNGVASSPQWEITVVLTLVATLEKRKRQRAAAAGAAGGAAATG